MDSSILLGAFCTPSPDVARAQAKAIDADIVNKLYRGDYAMIGWIVALIVGLWLVCLVSYALFGPFADTLPQKLAVNMTWLFLGYLLFFFRRSETKGRK